MFLFNFWPLRNKSLRLRWQAYVLLHYYYSMIIPRAPIEIKNGRGGEKSWQGKSFQRIRKLPINYYKCKIGNSSNTIL